MQQQPPLPGMPGNFPLASITSEQIQKYLDENKQLILAILDNQNLGKLAECAQYQAQLQKNLLYLAAIADAQPQVPVMRAPTFPNAGTSLYLQQQQQQQQLPMFSPRPPSTSVAFNPLQQFHRPQQLLSTEIRPGTNNVDTSAGYSDAIRRSSVEDRSGATDNRNQSLPPSSSSPLQRV